MAEEFEVIDSLPAITTIVGKRENAVLQTIPARYKWFFIDKTFETIISFKYDAGDMVVD